MPIYLFIDLLDKIKSIYGWSLIPEAQRLIRVNIREMHSLCLPILFLVFRLHKNLQHRNVKKLCLCLYFVTI